MNSWNKNLEQLTILPSRLGVLQNTPTAPLQKGKTFPNECPVAQWAGAVEYAVGTSAEA